MWVVGRAFTQGGSRGQPGWIEDGKAAADLAGRWSLRVSPDSWAARPGQRWPGGSAASDAVLRPFASRPLPLSSRRYRTFEAAGRARSLLRRRGTFSTALSDASGLAVDAEARAEFGREVDFVGSRCVLREGEEELSSTSTIVFRVAECPRGFAFGADAESGCFARRTRSLTGTRWRGGADEVLLGGGVDQVVVGVAVADALQRLLPQSRCGRA